VIKGDFHRFIGPEPIRSSGHHSNLIVEILDGTTGNKLSRRAQRAKNPIIARVTGRLPSLHGICSTTTPCSAHSTRRGAYRKWVGIPHSGTNSQHRSASRS